MRAPGKRGRLAPAVLAAVATGCSAWHAQPLPAPVSRPVERSGHFRAGLARVDITPPPGLGMAGSGPEGRRSTGYRTRLYAQALVLEDSSGERIALVVADLAHVPANLHRLAAARLVESVGIGADRLIISATHTHSGPGHFYGDRQYNSNAARLAGYDPRVTDLLVTGVTRAVERATAAARPALAAWGTTVVPGVTWNRSLEAYCRNAQFASDSLCSKRDPAREVDDTLFMLRIDGLAVAGEKPVPLGSYSVFALHGTAIPSLNTLFDGDAHVRIAGRIAAHADASAGRPTVHLFANGAEGDAAPKIDRRDCDLPRPGLFDRIPMPRGPGELVDFIEPGPQVAERCVAYALEEVDRISSLVAARASDLYDTLGTRLGAVGTISRAFTTEWLPGHDGLCGAPEVGSSTAAGAEGLETRVRGWQWLVYGVLRLGLEEGRSGVDETNRGCQGPKRTLLGPIQAIAVVGEHGFPATAQLTVVRIDSLLLGAVPAEVTTVAGQRMRARMAAAATDGIDPASGGQVRQTVLIGLANGFLQYVTTPEEYSAQHYEGGSNLYGPGMAGFLERRLVELSERASRPEPSPVEVGPITAYPGPPSEIMAKPTAAPPERLLPEIEIRCEGGRLLAEWRDLAPGRIFPRESPWVQIERQTESDEWEVVAVDGDGSLEIRAVRSRGDSGFEWRAEWRRPPVGRFKLVRLADSVSAGRESHVAPCGAPGE